MWWCLDGDSSTFALVCIRTTHIACILQLSVFQLLFSLEHFHPHHGQVLHYLHLPHWHTVVWVICTIEMHCPFFFPMLNTVLILPKLHMSPVYFEQRPSIASPVGSLRRLPLLAYPSSWLLGSSESSLTRQESGKHHSLLMSGKMMVDLQSSTPIMHIVVLKRVWKGFLHVVLYCCVDSGHNFLVQFKTQHLCLCIQFWQKHIFWRSLPAEPSSYHSSGCTASDLHPNKICFASYVQSILGVLWHSICATFGMHSLVSVSLCYFKLSYSHKIQHETHSSISWSIVLWEDHNTLYTECL